MSVAVGKAISECECDYTHLSERAIECMQELTILNRCMNGMVQSEVCAELGIGRGTINHRKASIRQRYYNLYGAL